MRIVSALAIAGLAFFAPVAVTLARAPEFTSADIVLHWINTYRHRPDPASVPAALRALSRFGALRDPDSSGVYVGFLAGIIGSNPDAAEDIVNRLFPLPAEDHWLIVRAIAYSGLPDWKDLLREFADNMPAREAMIEKYLAGALPTLAEVAPEKTPTLFDRLRRSVSVEKEERTMTWALDASSELLDILWGYYFATGDYGPILRIITMLPWSKDRDHVERLTLGSMAKYTLAMNATRDAELRSMLKRASRHQPIEVAPILGEVIDAAETVQTGRIRKEALAAIEELRRNGPGAKRDVAWWGKIGEGAIGLGCVAAAVTGQVELGIPCVVGGAVSSAAIRYWAGQ